MSTPAIPSTPRPATSTADASASPTPLRPGRNTAAPDIDQVTQQPLPPRFPWLSRLSQQLENAAKQKPAFAPAPVLGDHLDRSV